ncbi:mucin-associated surface protein [Leifsonia rubra CMS 76R]|nr:mucin-associated surface protein [Leifsonia rubra CMS 76R]
MSAWGRAATRIVAAACAAMLVTAALSGCAPTKPELDSVSASTMQESVAAVTQAAADGDPVGALAALDTLQAQLKEDTASGLISADRSAQIQASIDLVRADLTAALPEPSPTPPKKDPGKSGDKGDDKKDDKKDKNG